MHIYAMLFKIDIWVFRYSILTNNIVYFSRVKDGVHGVLLHHKQVPLDS